MTKNELLAILNGCSSQLMTVNGDRRFNWRINNLLDIKDLAKDPVVFVSFINDLKSLWTKGDKKQVHLLARKIPSFFL